MENKSDTKRGRGQPTSYKEDYARQAYELALLGLTDEDMIRVFDIAPQTFYNWRNAHPEFLEALKRGKDAADAKVAVSLYKRATGYEHEAVKIFNDQGAPLIVDYIERYPPDTTAAIFWLKNRQRATWRDKQDVEQTVTAKVDMDATVSHKVAIDFSDIVSEAKSVK